MENNLYYTPTIEEFHIGFEYEYMNGDLWEKSKITIQDYKSDGPDYERSDSWFQEEILGGIRTIRVKYLDREDIESLGWIHDINMSELEYESFYIEPGYDEKNKFIQYSLQNYKNGKVYLDKCINSGLHEIGFLTIKNKSELIKLMKQLDIK